MNVIYDAGEMINVGIELGQIEGGMIMGLGWLKSEDLTWDENGAKQRGTWEYKVPMHLDIPRKFSIKLTNKAPEWKNIKNRNYPMSSKHAGESSMVLSLVLKTAVQNAAEAFNPDSDLIILPMKPHHVMQAIKLNKDSIILT